MRVQSNEKGQAWFCLSDVCRVLSLTNSSEVKRRLKQPGITTAEVGVQTGTKQDGSPAIQFVNLTFIDEPNLYRCIFQSRKKEAEAFQDWVVEEVLPAIRKTGGYIPASEGTRKLVECIAVLNDHYNQTVNALNSAFGSNEVSAKMLMKEYGPAFEGLMSVLHNFLCRSVMDKIDGEEIGEI